MYLERTKNTKRNIVFGLINKIITIFLPFIIRTLLIKEIGAEFLGINSLFSSILQVLNLTELGFSNAIVFSLYKPIAEDDELEINSILNFYKKVYLIIGTLILMMGGLLTPFLKFLIKGDYPEELNIYLLFLIYLLNTVLSYILFGYRTVILSAYQRNDISSKISTVIFLITYITQLFVILVTKNFYFFAITNIIATILNNVLIYVSTKKYFPTLICKGRISHQLKLSIREKIGGLMISKVTGISRNALDSIFLSAFLGLVETAKYNNYYYIMTAVTGFLLIIYSSISAGVGNSVVMETEEKNYNDFQKFNFLYMWLAGWCTVCLVVLYQPFIELFFGKNMMFEFPTVILFSLYFYLLRSGDILAVYSEANGLWWKSKYITIAETIGNVVLNFVLGKLFGVNGIITGTFISMLFTTNSIGAFIPFREYFKNQKIRNYFISQIKYFLITVLAAVLTIVICAFIKVGVFLELIIRMIICVIIPNFIYFVFYKKNQLFSESVIWLKKIFYKKDNKKK